MVFEVIILFYNVWILFTAWHTPRRPEVNQNVFSFIVRKLYGFIVRRICHNIRCSLTYGQLSQLINLSLELIYIAIVWEFFLDLVGISNQLRFGHLWIQGTHHIKTSEVIVLLCK